MCWRIRRRGRRCGNLCKRSRLRLAAGIALLLCAATLVLYAPLSSLPPKHQADFAARTVRRSAPGIDLPQGTVDVNGADLYELTELPGIGETLAQAIIDERNAHGAFRYPEDLLAVRGIGAKKLEGFRDWLDLSGEVRSE